MREQVRVSRVGVATLLLFSVLVGVGQSASVQVPIIITLPTAGETTLFSDNFDTYAVGSFPSAGGWEVVWGGTGQNVIVSDPSVSKPNAFQLWGKPNWSAVVQRKFSTTAPVIGYEFSIRIEKIGTGTPGREESPAFFNRDVATWGGYYAMVQFCHDTRRIKTVDGTVLGQWAPGVWYRVKVILDRRTNLFSVWIDGRLAAENIYTAGDTYQINALALFSGHPGVKVWYDEVRVFAVTDEALRAMLTTSRGCGGSAVFQIGEQMQAMFRVEGAGQAYVRLLNILPTEAKTVFEGPVNRGDTITIPGTAGEPAGARLLRLEVWGNMLEFLLGRQPTTKVECAFTVVAPSKEREYRIRVVQASWEDPTVMVDPPVATMVVLEGSPTGRPGETLNLAWLPGQLKWDTDWPRPAANQAFRIWVAPVQFWGMTYEAVVRWERITQHFVSTPDAPTGPSEGTVGEVLQFHISGGECVHGHFVHYRLDWGDGTFSDWLDVGTLILIFYRPTHAWDREGTYQVRVQSRCAVDTSIVSEWSLAKVVTIWVEKEEEFALAGDYGDAPDPGFPTQASSNGPCHLDVSKEWIGPAGRSTTTIDGGPQGIDSDQDDGAPSFWRTGRLTWFSIVVSYDPTKSSAADPRFLNVLLDVDRNGRWEGDKGEWVVQNLEVDFRRVLPQGATSQRLVVLVNPTINPEALAGCWARITLSNRAVLDGSGAWGVFERGETEDHLLSGPGSPPPCAKKVVELLIEKLLEVGTEETVTYWDGECHCGFEGKLISKDGGSPYYWDIPVPPIPWPNTISLRFVSVRQDVLGFDAPPCSRLLDATAGVDPVSHLFRGDWSLKLNAAWTVIAGQDRGPLSPFQYGRTHVKAFLKFPSFPGHDVVRVELEARVDCDGEWVVVTQFSDPAPVVRAK